MTLKRSLVLIVLQLLFVFVFGMMLVGPRIFPNPENMFQPSLALSLFIVAATLFGAVGLVWYGSVKSVGRTWRDLGWHADQLPAQIALGVLGGVVCCGVLTVVLLVLGVPLSEIFASMRDLTLAERLTFLAIGVQAAFIEESLFRGNLLPALERKMSGKAATPLSAVIFAAYHLNPNPVSLVSKTVFGLVYAGLRKAKGSLVAPAIAHGLFWTVVGSM